MPCGSNSPLGQWLLWNPMVPDQTKITMSKSHYYNSIMYTKEYIAEKYMKLLVVNTWMNFSMIKMKLIGYFKKKKR